MSETPLHLHGIADVDRGLGRNSNFFENEKDSEVRNITFDDLRYCGLRGSNVKSNQAKSVIHSHAEMDDDVLG